MSWCYWQCMIDLTAYQSDGLWEETFLGCIGVQCSAAPTRGEKLEQVVFWVWWICSDVSWLWMCIYILVLLIKLPFNLLSVCRYGNILKIVYLFIYLFIVFQAHDRPYHRPSLCPRFLSHMKARPEDLRPPCFLSSKSRQQPPFQGKTSNTHTFPALKTQTLEGEAYQQNTWCFHTITATTGGGHWLLWLHSSAH